MASHSEPTDIYCPDFSSVRLTGKNAYRTVRRNMYSEYDFNPVVRIERPHDADGLIPITPIDVLIDFVDISNVDRVLNKRNLFNDVVTMIDEFATSIRRKYNRYVNHDIMIATVPITSFVRSQSIPKSTIESSYHRSVGVDDDDTQRERFISIGGQRYSCSKYYDKHLRQMNIPSEAHSMVCTDEGKQIYRVSCVQCNKQYFTFTFDKEKTISSIILRPENMLFCLIHTDTIRCNGNCKKSKHTINVLKNDPGYITRFELQYRSEDTFNKWMTVGIFSGNQSMYDITHINFDEINVKQFRIIPISHVNSFDKVRIYPVGKMIIKPITYDKNVTYTLLMPRDGKYMKRYNYICDGMNKNTDRCDCKLCRGVKGWKKEKMRMFSEACDIDY
jgi:hypothetical protein